MPKIRWEEKVYEGETYEDILNTLSADSWFGSLEDLKKRILEFHKIDLTNSTAEEVFKTLEKLGDVEILK